MHCLFNRIVWSEAKKEVWHLGKQAEEEEVEPVPLDVTE